MVSRTLITVRTSRRWFACPTSTCSQDTAQRDALIDQTMRLHLLRAVAGGDNLYTISYRDPEPEKARKVVQSILTIFVESMRVASDRQDSAPRCASSTIRSRSTSKVCRPP